MGHSIARYENFFFSAQDFAANIREARKGRGLSQKQVSEILGVSVPTVSVWENNKGLPTIDHMLALCWLFEFNPIVFLVVRTEKAVKSMRMFSESVGEKQIATAYEFFGQEPLFDMSDETLSSLNMGSKK